MAEPSDLDHPLGFEAAAFFLRHSEAARLKNRACFGSVRSAGPIAGASYGEKKQKIGAHSQS
jgi:hypothetical protein